jgi:DNA-binding CsgD family transcriptional regulator
MRKLKDTTIVIPIGKVVTPRGRAILKAIDNLLRELDTVEVTKDDPSILLSVTTPFQNDWNDLSRAEKEIMLLVIEGYQVLQIAAMRGTSENTVDAQIGSIYDKLHVKNRTEAIRKLLPFSVQDGKVVLE